MSAIGEAREPNGFTLLEALVTMAVMVLIGGLVFPAVGQGVAAVAFQQAVSGLQADLVMARAQALRTGEPVELAVEADGRGYGWSPGPQRALIAGLTLATASGGVWFFSDGSSSGGALTLTQADRSRGFVVNPDTGLAGRTP